jgi:hypothetical protein
MPPMGASSKKMKLVLGEDACTPVHWGVGHNRRDREAAKVPTDEQISNDSLSLSLSLSLCHTHTHTHTHTYWNITEL